MALVGVELETLVSDPDTLTTRPPPCAHTPYLLIKQNFDCTHHHYFYFGLIRVQCCQIKTFRVEFRKPDRAWIKPGSWLKQHFSFPKGSSSRDQLSRP